MTNLPLRKKRLTLIDVLHSIISILIYNYRLDEVQLDQLKYKKCDVLFFFGGKGKMFRKLALSVLITCVFSSISVAAELKIVHSDPEWTGKKVPKKGICKLQGGDLLSPPFKVSGIPAGTTKLELYFTDEDYGNEGGHGGFEVKISGESEISYPEMEGQADDKMPTNVKGIQRHHDSRSAGNYYLGACSGNKYHDYTLYIYAKNASGDKLAKGNLKLGSY